MSHKKQGYRFENDWSMDLVQHDAESIAAAVVLPVNEEINAKNTVLNVDSVKKYLKRSHRIALGNCACRSSRKHCDAPVDVCMALNKFADSSLGKGYWTTTSDFVTNVREITLEEALEVVDRGHKAGLVSMAYIGIDSPEPHDPNAICQCCSCCCAELGLTLRFGLAPHMLKGLAIAMTDLKKCISCGTCVDKCHFGARAMKDGKLEFDKDFCFGCGVCTDTCPNHAISLVHFPSQL